jgi:hypothetical protein
LHHSADVLQLAERALHLPDAGAHRVDGLRHPLLYACGVARNANFYFIV